MQVVTRAHAVVTPRIATAQRAPVSVWTTQEATTASFVRTASMETRSMQWTPYLSEPTSCLLSNTIFVHSFPEQARLATDRAAAVSSSVTNQKERLEFLHTTVTSPRVCGSSLRVSSLMTSRGWNRSRTWSLKTNVMSSSRSRLTRTFNFRQM